MRAYIEIINDTTMTASVMTSSKGARCQEKKVADGIRHIELGTWDGNRYNPLKGTSKKSPKREK